MPNTSAAQLVRSALKAAGFHSRRVTVRDDHNTLRLTIRDASVPLSAVQAIAGPFESVRRCEATGEILCGGNTFVDVKYVDALVAPVAAVVDALLSLASDGEVVDVGGGYRAAKVSRQLGATYPDEVRLWGPGLDDHSSIACGVSWAARRIAVAYLNATASRTAAAVEKE